MTSLNDRLLNAYARGAHAELVSLYSEAAECTKDIDERCFFFTQAYVFALEQGHPDKEKLYQKLAQYDRI